MYRPNKALTGDHQHSVNLTAVVADDASVIAGVEPGPTLGSDLGGSLVLAFHRPPRSIGTRPGGDAARRRRPPTVTSPALA
jgi:hypothetical protein